MTTFTALSTDLKTIPPVLPDQSYQGALQDYESPYTQYFTVLQV